MTAEVMLRPTDRVYDDTPLFSFDYGKDTMYAGQLETEDRGTIWLVVS